MELKNENILNYIGGELVPPVGGKFFANTEPATGQSFGQIPDSDDEDVSRAVAAAKAAFPIWSKLPAKERSDLLLKIADGIAANREVLAMAESKDNGKPLALAKQVDIPRAEANFRFFATAVLHTHTESHLTDGEALNYTLRTPLGVAGCISPWNLPLYLFTWKIAPALATGNTVVAKPSEVTPLTAFLLSQICQEAGLPPGVLNIVHGVGPKAGQAIVAHPDVAAVSFTGGTATGKQIAATAAPMFKKLSLELGGKNPNILFADCDFDQALETSLRSSFANQGQICLCGSRILIEESIYALFKEAFVSRVKAMKVGDPLEAGNQMGALVSKAHFEKVQSYIALACEEGGTILAGGHPVEVGGRCSGGYFLAPTVIEGLGPHCRTNQEEIFGPVVTLQPFSSEDEAVANANSTAYGLAASLWTGNASRAHRIAAQIKSGIVWVNCWMLRDLRTPFGGMKQSGVGREGGEEALRFFTETQNICIKY